MPLKITGKIVDDTGLPLLQIAQIAEIPTPPSIISAGNVWSDPDTGTFTFLALDPNNMITITAIGYKVQTYKASSVPKVITLEPAIVIEGNTSKKVKDNTMWWVLGGIAVAVAIGVVSKKPSKQLPVRKTKALPKPKTVIV